jgi:hypothetical protein
LRGSNSIGIGVVGVRNEIVRPVAAAVGAVAGGAAAFLFRGHLERRQRRLLPNVPRRDLVDRDAGERRMALPRVLARQPGRRHDRVHGRALGRLVAEAADDRHVLLQRLERLEDRLEVEITAHDVGRPAIHFRAKARVVHDRAVGQVEEAHARFRGRGRLRERRGGRHHRREQR